jgi:hypothetical protein
MNIEKIKQFALLATELMAEGIIGFSIHTKRFHVSRENIKGFENLKIKVRGALDGDYPFEISHKGDGFTIFCLVTTDELKHFPQFLNFYNSELLKQLVGLEEGEQSNEATN